MEVDHWQTGLAESWQPDSAPEIAMPQWCAGWAGEYQCLLARLGHPAHVLLDSGHDHVGNDNHPFARFGLGRT
jgi:hypothetical protein